MPAKELSPTQKADADRLKARFKFWQGARTASGQPSSQEHAAEAMSFGQSAMSQYLNGKIPLNADAAARFAQLLGCDVAAFSPSIAEEIRVMAAGLEVEPRSAEQSRAVALAGGAHGANEDDDLVRIEQFDTGGKMGHGLILQDQPGVIRSWTVSQDWVRKNVHRITSPSNLAIVTGFGDSMRPLYNPGDPLLLDRGVRRPDIDGIYFFRVADEGYVKRLQRIPTVDGVVIRAKSDNPKYDPFDIVKGMDFEVFGRVVKAWRGEDF